MSTMYLKDASAVLAVSLAECILIGFRFLFLLMYFECVTCASCIWQKIICNFLVKGKSKPESNITKRNRERIII